MTKEPDFKRLYLARGEVMVAAHHLFVYAQNMSHKISTHKLQSLLPSPDDQITAYIQAIEKSRVVHIEETFVDGVK